MDRGFTLAYKTHTEYLRYTVNLYFYLPVYARKFCEVCLNFVITNISWYKINPFKCIFIFIFVCWYCWKSLGWENEKLHVAVKQYIRNKFAYYVFFVLQFEWSTIVCNLLNIPMEILPEIRDTRYCRRFMMRTKSNTNCTAHLLK